MRKKAFIIVGLGYGDEGKGLVSDYLCSKNSSPLVIRFNGGHQAGHTVMTSDGQKHVLSSFGSGTLRGVPTYWSNYCTFSPAFFLEEYETLNITPKLFLDRLCPITTHYDVLFNRAIEVSRGASRHGSTGTGFSSTVERHTSIQLVASDIVKPTLFFDKLAEIKSYYKSKIDKETTFRFDQFDHDAEDRKISSYLEKVRKLIDQGIVILVNESEMLSPDNKDWDSFIFEGAQGILLDVNFGFKPHVTQSNTTSKNALELLERNFGYMKVVIEIFYVTRAYQTRHGAGPFYESSTPMKLKGLETETNQYNEYQGEFRISCLNIDQLNYSLECDRNFSDRVRKNLVVTCLDQINPQNLMVYKNGEEVYIKYHQIPDLLSSKFEQIKYSFSPSAEVLDTY